MPEGPFEHDSSVIEPERNVYCKSYDSCLDSAIESGWTSWHCSGCTTYEPCTPMKAQDDAVPLLQLVGEIFYPMGCKKRREPA